MIRLAVTTILVIWAVGIPCNGTVEMEKKNCLPYPIIEDIAVEFLANGNPKLGVPWEQV